MTKDELAARLDGKDRPLRIPPDLLMQARRDRLVIVYGESDDLMEFEGAITEEIGCYGGGYALVDDRGVLPSRDSIDDDDDDALRDYLVRKPHCWKVTAQWCDTGPAWQLSTDIPNATFHITDPDEAEPFCRGLVFCLDDLDTLALPFADGKRRPETSSSTSHRADDRAQEYLLNPLHPASPIYQGNLQDDDTPRRSHDPSPSPSEDRSSSHDSGSSSSSDTSSSDSGSSGGTD